MTTQGTVAFFSSATASVQRLLNWWTGQLRELVSMVWAGNDEPRIECRVVDHMILLRIFRRRRPMAEGTLDPQSGLIRPLDIATMVAREARRLPVEFFVAADLVLTQTIKVPRSAAPLFEQLISAEIDRWTPFSLQEVVVAWRPVRNIDAHQVEIELRVVPRSAIDGRISSLKKAGLNVTQIVLDGSPILKAALRNPAERKSLRRLLRTAAIAVLCASSVILVSADWMAALRDRDAWRGRVDAERRLLTQQRSIEEQISSLLAASGDGSNRLSLASGGLLGAISTKVPAADWLTDVSITGGTVTLRGYSVAVEELLKALEPLALDRAVNIQGELGSDPRLNRQRFTLSFKIGAGSK